MTKLALLLPSSLTQQEPDPRIRTYKVGQLGRAASIFRVRDIVVYGDLSDPAHNDARFIETVLRYQECPPYLRKRLFKLAPELEFAGVLPPLNTPTHIVSRDAKVGEVREALATKTGIEMGANKPARSRSPLPEGERVSVRVVADLGRELVVEPHSGPDHYPGYRVARAESLHQALQPFDARIATSRAGEPVAKLPLEKLRGRVALVFGPPEKSVEEVAAAEGIAPAWDFVLNAAPGQGTETIRTEEAVLLSLGALAGRLGP